MAKTNRLTKVNLRVNLNKEIIFYKKATNDVPVQAFLDGLSGKTAQKVVWVLSLIEAIDPIPKQYFKKLQSKDNIWECRIKLGSNIYRILCFWDNYKLVLTNGFIKKTNKLPKTELDRTIQYKKDYFKAGDKHE